MTFESPKVHNVKSFFTENRIKGKRCIIDNGAPLALNGLPWIEKYCLDNDLKIEELDSEEAKEKFQFGPSQVYVSKKKLHIPLVVDDKKGRAVRIIVKSYLVDADVPLLIGKNVLFEWGASTNHKINTLSCTDIIEGETVEFHLDQTMGGHDALKLENIKEESTEKTVSFITEQIKTNDSNVFDFKKVKHLHEITNHKQEENMLYAYRNAGVLTDGGRRVIKRVIDSCKICKKFKRSSGTPKVALPKPVDFNEIVALDLKQMGKRHILWMICTFTRFIKGVVIKDKEAETIIDALQNGWNLNFGFLS